MRNISNGEKRSLLGGLLIFYIAMALVFVYRTATEPLYLARQNHILVIIFCLIAALGVFIARKRIG